MKFKSLLLAACCGVVVATVTSGASSADTQWDVSGLFNDGGNLSGVVTSNVYNYLSSWNLVTTAGSEFVGAVYDAADGNYSSQFAPTYEVAFNSGLNAPPTLFAQLTSASNNGALLNFSGYECTGFTCNSSTAIRTFTGAAVAVPGPEAGTGFVFASLAAACLFWRRRRVAV